MGSHPSTFQQPVSQQTAEVGSDDYSTTVKPNQPEFLCTTCARNYKHVSANIYCKSCRDHLCFRCLQWHSKYNSDHVDDLRDKDEMRKLGVQGSPVMPTEKCLDHDDKLWNMFCQKDGIAGCQQCMDENHRACKSVIPRSTTHIEATNRQTPNDGQVGGRLKQMSLDDGQVDGRQRRSHQSDDLQVGGELGQNFADDGQVDEQKRERDDHSERSQVGGKFRNVAQSQHDDQVDGSKKINKRSATSSTDDGQVPGLSITDVEKPTRHEDDGQVSGNRNQHVGLYSVGSGRDVNVRLDNDCETCWIYDISVLSDGRILMSDYWINKVKLLDSNFNIIDHCVVPNKPIGMCMINDNIAAVTLGDSTIQFVTIEDKIELGRRIELDHHCNGIAYSGGELYVTDLRTNICAYTVEGEKLRTIETGLSEESVAWCERLTVSKDGSRIYMSNYLYGIVCVDRLSGQVIWKVKDTDGNQYSGICVDRYNNVLVCRYWKDDVVQFSPSGQLTGVVISESDGLQLPIPIIIDEVRNRLIVGMHGDSVKVFDFKS